MRNSIRKIGNSAGIVIPKILLAEIGAKPGDPVDLVVEDGRLIVERARKEPRVGWAEASKRLAAEGDDGLVWPEFANEEDAELVW